ncbi:hypothetical protein VCSRO94_2336 [Vibrio cholerae]|nr:hypothetical protein VCSRO94_2336 [Vibrio cholerae]
MNRLQVALIALVVGWGLSQLTEYVKAKRKIKKLKSAIELELQDLEELLEQREKTAKSSALSYFLYHSFCTVAFHIKHHFVCATVHMEATTGSASNRGNTKTLCQLKPHLSDAGAR